MNKILQLKGKFRYQQGNSKAGPRKLPAEKFVEAEHIGTLKTDLQRVLQYWKTHTLIRGALVSVYYNSVVAKSNRIRGLLCKGSADPNDSIRGAKFSEQSEQEENIRHIFTHYVPLEIIEESIKRLTITETIIQSEFGGRIGTEDIEAINNKTKKYLHGDKLARTNFVNVVVDAYYVRNFGIELPKKDSNESSIITLYRTDIPTSELFDIIGIDYINARCINDTTVLLDPADIELLQEKAPYLIAMRVHDLREIPAESFPDMQPTMVQIPAPKNEPVIGIIDTPFSEDVYFHDWVTYQNMLGEDIPIEPQDYNHGTAVASIIVDGPTIDPTLDDGCGRFRVKHFGVAKAGRFSSYSVLRNIREAVSQNRDIKVWNLSLGSDSPVKPNFISPEGAELDKIQSEFDVIFVVAGTNGNGEPKPIGAPADSLNSLVVNAVTRERMPASYHRVGPVLSFFHKPDISCFGGDRGQPMKVCTSTGEGYVCGTSFSAPWIARKLAYLICTLGFSREVAKALIIDAAAGWERQDDVSCAVGYGVVPTRIEDIVNSRDDEIRFVMMGTTDAYETYTYELPVPINKGKQPFYARATLCYFPKCMRDQGVDYTSTEMDIHFGRVVQNGNSVQVKSINANAQGDEGGPPTFEPEARKLYRKWDNVKLISDELKDRAYPRKVYGAGMWGLKINTKERLKEKNGRGLSFGVVVTLREMYGVNRIDEFIKMCMLRGWIVNEIDVQNQLDVYQKAEEDIEF